MLEETLLEWLQTLAPDHATVRQIKVWPTSHAMYDPWGRT